ncbi:MAG: choice-of-anchor D domain-containing protein [Burkholderiaceae bacterium]|jgi:hypothetical protein
MKMPPGYKPLPGSERPQVPGSSPLGPVEEKDHVAATLLLRPRPGSAEEHDLDHWQRTPPQQRQFLSAEEYMRQYGSAEEDVRAIEDFAKSKGLQILESDAGRRRVVVEGPVGKINAAFGVTLHWYRSPLSSVHRPRRSGDAQDATPAQAAEEVHHGFDGPLFVPGALVDVITAVLGLDNRKIGGPAGVGTGDPPGAAYLSPQVVGEVYSFPNTGAVGTTIGIFEDAASGAAYLHSDIFSFIASLPPAYQTNPVLTDIGLKVGLITYGNNGALVTTSPTPAVGECGIDVSIAAAIAQGANINVYFTENSEAGWEAFLNRALFPHVGDNPPSVLTASWLLSFGDDASRIGHYATPGTVAFVLSHHLRTAAVRGITVFMAIGDWGSANTILDGHCHVSYPNADPWSTACGGTIVGDITAPPIQFKEFVWSDAHVASLFDDFPFAATGGGVSDNFPVPLYQTAGGVHPISKNDGNPRRGVPDVAGMIGMNGFFFAGAGGPGHYDFVGTSLVAPLYAGLVAVIVKLLGRNVGFLNPTFYELGTSICHDVRFGNNESGNPPIDAPVYVAGPGWDACTGWGSINGFRLLAALAPVPIIVTAIAEHGNFGEVCVDSFRDQILTINNTGFALMLISDITSSSPDFIVPTAGYPLAIAAGDSMDLVIRFRPKSRGVHSGIIQIFSNTLLGVDDVAVIGFAPAPRLVLAMADTGSFGAVCVGGFKDAPLVVSNSGHCPLAITHITSSSSDFLPPEVVSYPIVIAPGEAISLPIRFQPTSHGAKSGTLTIASNDPTSPESVAVTGEAPAGRLVVTGSACFGGIPACTCAERTLSLCNVGECELKVTSVAFRRKSRYWRLVNNPFPATLHPGSCLALVIRYKAEEKCPRSCDLVIHSDDPHTPVKVLEMLAYTQWDAGCGSKGCEDCRRGHCAKHSCDPCCSHGCNDCCDDEDDGEHSEGHHVLAEDD